MEIINLQKAIKEDRVNITQHAFKEANDDDLNLNDIFYSVQHGEVIEDYPMDKPYPSCLVYGNNHSGEPVHSVWAYSIENQIAVLITVYRPDEKRWIAWKIRKKYDE